MRNQLDIKITSCDAPPDHEQMTALLREYYDLMVQRIIEMGAKVPQGEAIAEFWDNIHDYLPPKGQLLLAQNTDGHLVGTASLKSLPDGRAEMKRLYVKPEMRGSGLGRRLILVRMETARKMGVKELLADTMTANIEMQGLYNELGFEEIQPDPESTTFQLLPELRPHLLFYRYRF